MRPDETIPARLLVRAERSPDRVFANVGRTGDTDALTFAELADRAGAFALSLAALGVTADDVVPIALPTSTEYVVAVFGCHFLGAAIAPLPPLTSTKEEHVRLHTERLRGAAARCRSRVAVVTSSAAETLGSSIDPSTLELATVEALTSFSKGISWQGPFPPDRIAVVQFSSGSTAAPKGVRITFRNIKANAETIARRVGITERDSMLSFLPLFHDFGLFGGIIYPFMWDVPTWLFPTEEFIRRPSFWLKAMSFTRATMCPAPQFAYQVALHRIRDRDLEGVDLSAWRVAYNGGEPVHAATLRAFNDRFASLGLAPTTVLPSYGMAESTLAVAIHTPGSEFRTERISRDALSELGIARPDQRGTPAMEVVSCGPPLDGIEVSILTDEGTAAREREVGEIAIRGDSVARNYFVGPGELEPLERDGWFRTGDLGYLADGLLFVTGRVKDLIIRGGRNYFPQDIERAIEPLEGVRLNGVVAFGCYDDADGMERIIAVIEIDTLDQNVILALRDRARRAVFDTLEVTLDDVILKRKGWIPKTTSGKLQRAKARSLYLEASRRESARGVL
jgi:acyl-CoA synthetase (AMP-forming)/AMP-acid ligase II